MILFTILAILAAVITAFVAVFTAYVYLKEKDSKVKKFPSGMGMALGMGTGFLAALPWGDLALGLVFGTALSIIYEAL